MIRKGIARACAIALGIIGSGSFTEAPAQVATDGPASNVGGYAAMQLNRIHQQSVGTGYTVGSLNQIALQNARLQAPNLNRLSQGAPGPASLGLNTSLAAKPFSSYSPAPTTSPYLNLFREDFEGNSDLNYNTLVRPLLQQQRFNEQLQRQATETARRLQAISAQPSFNPQGSQSQHPTGHRTVFNYLGHYYPSAVRGRR